MDSGLEIFGFSENSKKAYIMEAFKGNITKAKQLLALLSINPTISAFCYIPLNMTILLCLFNEGALNTECLTTQTEINKRFICIIISRFIMRADKHHCGISEFSEIPEFYKHIFSDVCKLAFESLLNNKLVFTKTEIHSVCKHLTQNPIFKTRMG